MAYQLPDPQALEKTIALYIPKQYKAEGAEDTWVRIKQATVGDDAARSELWANVATEWDDQQQGKMRQYRELATGTILMQEVYLTLLESNLLDHKGKVLFGPIASTQSRGRKRFLAAWNSLPIWLGELIHDAVLEVNPQWRPGGEDDEDLGEA